MISAKQLQQARVEFVKHCDSSGMLTVPQARYEFDRFLVKEVEIRTKEEYFKSRRAGAAFKIGESEKNIIWGYFSESVEYATW